MNRNRHLRDQSTKDKIRFFETAWGSALESAAIHDILSTFEYEKKHEQTVADKDPDRAF